MPSPQSQFPIPYPVVSFVKLELASFPTLASVKSELDFGFSSINIVENGSKYFALQTVGPSIESNKNDLKAAYNIILELSNKNLKIEIDQIDANIKIYEEELFFLSNLTSVESISSKIRIQISKLKLRSKAIANLSDDFKNTTIHGEIISTKIEVLKLRFILLSSLVGFIFSIFIVILRESFRNY